MHREQCLICYDEKEYMPGGQVVQTYEVDNYPEFQRQMEWILIKIFRACERTEKYITAEVKEIYVDEEIKEIMQNGDTLKTRIILQQEHSSDFGNRREEN